MRRTKFFFRLHSLSTDAENISSPPTIDSTPKKDVPTSLTVNGWACHRGIGIYVRNADGTPANFSCLCPPSSYGSRCEFQNQRVSLTVQIHAGFDWRIAFRFLLILMDNDGSVESFEQLDYLSFRDCDQKFHQNLLYSTRPKNPSKLYSVRLDAFEKSTLDYRASWIFPLDFPFLPVHRLAVLLNIPSEPISCALVCLHGHCSRTVNQPNVTFCRCEFGWSGVQCQRRSRCDCVSGSLSVADSICLCPLDRFGPRCSLLHTACHSKPCHNNGQCLPNDERRPSRLPWTCLCPLGYSGQRCEDRQTRLEIHFDRRVPIPSALLVHFVTLEDDLEPARVSLMKKVTWDQSSLAVYTSSRFHLAFVQIFDQFYSIVRREQSVISARIALKIHPSSRCRSLSELFNETFVQRHLLRRIKFYHIPCREQRDLVCFSDSIHLCLCDRFRRAYCFEFDHYVNQTCRRDDICVNQGQCFQDDSHCPTSFQCICPKCFYGSRCQYSTQGSILSLDTIIGYQIQMNVPIHQQPMIIRTATSVTIVLFILGFLSNSLCYLTFRRKTTCDVGCGIYLFALSVVSLLALSLFTSKFFILLLSQIHADGNSLFQQMHCILTDFLLRVLLTAGDWLTACVAIERALTVLQGTRFNRKRSKQLARWVISIVISGSSASYIYDPLYRRRINDVEAQRFFCVAQYSASVLVFDRLVNILHFSFPFAINGLSAMMIIIQLAQRRSKLDERRSYREVFLGELNQHKNLVISPAILLLLTLPRLFMSILPECMESARNPWFYACNCYISFIPPMLTFVIFVQPSKNYRRECFASLKRFFSAVQRRNR